MYKMSIEVHLSDTDVTGQVYYSKPLEWMEWCRVGWFQEKYGNFMKYVEESGITFFPSRVNVDYRKPIMFGDSLDIEMISKDIKKVSFTLDYTIKRHGDVILTGEVLMVCFDVKKNKFAKLEGDLLDYINKIS